MDQIENVAYFDGFSSLGSARVGLQLSKVTIAVFTPNLGQARSETMLLRSLAGTRPLSPTRKIM